MIRLRKYNDLPCLVDYLSQFSSDDVHALDFKAVVKPSGHIALST